MCIIKISLIILAGRGCETSIGFRVQGLGFRITQIINSLLAFVPADSVFRHEHFLHETPTTERMIPIPKFLLHHNTLLKSLPINGKSLAGLLLLPQRLHSLDGLVDLE
jgi:hypothetical protein